MKRISLASLDSMLQDPSLLGFRVQPYLQAGGNPNWRNPKTGESLLHRCHVRPLQEIRLLLDSGADIQARDRSGWSVLHAFCFAPLPIVRLLIARGADITAVARNGVTVLDELVHNEACTPAFLRSLQRRGAKFSFPKGKLPTPVARLAYGSTGSARSEKHVFRTIRMLHASGLSFSAIANDGTSALWIALHRHAEELISYRSYIRHYPGTRGSWKSRSNHTASLILELGANPNMRFSGRRHPLIPKGATPLMVRRYDTTTLTRNLLRHGADPTLTCSAGKTAIDYARMAAKQPELVGNEAAARVVGILEKAMKVARKRPRSAG